MRGRKGQRDKRIPTPPRVPGCPPVPRSGGVGKGRPPKPPESPGILRGDGSRGGQLGGEPGRRGVPAGWGPWRPLRRAPVKETGRGRGRLGHRGAARARAPCRPSAAPFVPSVTAAPFPSHLPFFPLPHCFYPGHTEVFPSSSYSSFSSSSFFPAGPALLLSSVPKLFSLPGARIAFPAPPSTCPRALTFSPGSRQPFNPLREPHPSFRRLGGAGEGAKLFIPLPKRSKNGSSRCSCLGGKGQERLLRGISRLPQVCRSGKERSGHSNRQEEGENKRKGSVSPCQINIYCL